MVQMNKKAKTDVEWLNHHAVRKSYNYRVFPIDDAVNVRKILLTFYHGTNFKRDIFYGSKYCVVYINYQMRFNQDVFFEISSLLA
jgi:hypothetical protein